MSNLKQRKEADKASGMGVSAGKKPRSKASQEARERKAKRRQEGLPNRVAHTGLTGSGRAKAKRKAKREAQRKELASVKAQLLSTQKMGMAREHIAPLQQMVEELSPKRRPPEPVVFSNFDWAREAGNLIYCGNGHGKKARKYRFPSARGVEIVAMSIDEKTGRLSWLVKLPLGLALEVYGKV